MNDKPEYLPWLREVIDKQVVDLDQGVISAELCCPLDLPAFDGHFPGKPVLPAVIQLVTVRMLAGEFLQMPLEMVETGKMKFKAMIEPEETIQIRVALEQIDRHWRVVFKLKNHGSIVSSGTILFKEGSV